MVFNSYAFVLIYLPAVVVLYHLINGKGLYTAGKLFLLAASVLFYCLNDAAAFPVLVTGIVVNYLLSLMLCRTGSMRKFILCAGIILNLAALVYFKYLGFFEGIVSSLLKTGISAKEVLLPLGISYYTFSQIAFLVDSYKAPDRRFGFLDYALFVSFFPKISVGPIAFARDMIPQFNESIRKKADPDNIAAGMVLFAAGLAKKVLLADNLAPYVSWGYSNLEVLGTTNALIVMLAYTMQIYFDFSGCCDMAKAVCLMLNLDLPDNFLSPYKAVSVEDFWRRWHITLTSFFRQYVYIPLGGNRKGKARTYINMFIIFFLSGLWHGAAWTFVVWGMIHGAGISLSKLLKDKTARLPAVLRRIGTFIFINLTWVLFRAPDMASAAAFFRQLFSRNLIPINIELAAQATPDEMQFIQWLIYKGLGETPYYSACVIIIAFLLLSVFISMFCRNTVERISALCLRKGTVISTVLLLVLSILSLSGVTEYIYTNF
jgi:D-alanyl-lipoteichoic acid acyltransferase DltB (MBOAT superfamily)